MNDFHPMRMLMMLTETTVSKDQIEEAAWWLQRWVSGSMSDPDWDDSWTTMNYIQAFDLLHNIVGNRRSITKPVLWRVIIVSKKTAKQMNRTKRLLVSANGPFQSFSGSMDAATEFGFEHREENELPILVSAKPDPALVMFGMADLKASRIPAIRDALKRIDSWHYQDEVIVRVTAPLPLLTVDPVQSAMDDLV